MDSIKHLQNADSISSELLQQISNKGFYGKDNLFLSAISTKLAIEKSIEKYFPVSENKSECEKKNNTGNSINIYIEPYKGNNLAVLKIKKSLNLNLNLFDILIHGSIGTSEEIAYSDFDGLIIIKDQALNSKKILADTCYKLNKCLQPMYEFDPLQHHGWFVMKESDLKNYPQTYFPHELFEYAKSLLPDKGLEIELNLNDSYDYNAPFLNLCESILKKIRQNRPDNIYLLKGLLSQFMLLPSLYCQARDKKGVFKKFSFEFARKDFCDDDWEIMDQVSTIRKIWHYKINPFQKWFLTRSNPVFRRINLAAPRIPDDIRSELTDEFYERMNKLTEAMKAKLNVSL